MQRLLTCLVLIFFYGQLQAQKSINQFEFEGKKAYVIKDNQLFQVGKKNQLKPTVTFAKDVYDAQMYNGDLWIAREDGIQIYDITNFQIKDTVLAGKRMVGITQDATNRLWLVGLFDGAYRQKKENSYEFEPVFKATVNYTIEASNDHHVYIGTDYGLYKINIDDLEMLRFTEEAHSGHGLPDNLVEKLFLDDAGNLWVVMPDHISYIKGDNSMSEFPTFSYVGKQRNKVKQILGLNDEIYMMFTDLGTIVLDAHEISSPHSHSAEVFNAHETPAVKLSNAMLLAPKHLHSSPILTAKTNGNKTYFLSENGVWSVKTKKLIKHLKKNVLLKVPSIHK